MKLILMKTGVIKMSSILLLIISLQCHPDQQGPGTNSGILERIIVFYQWQVLRMGDTVLTNVEDSLDIFYYNDLILYRFGADYEITEMSEDSNEQLHSRLLSNGRNYRFFIYQDQQRTGLYYDSLEDKYAQLFPVDSFLRSRLSFSSSMFDIEGDSLVREKEDAVNREAVYIPRHKADFSYPDSIYMNFSAALNKLRFSFSEKMDHRWKKKLHKIRFVFNAAIAGDSQRGIPRREFVFRFDRATVSNGEEIMQLIEKYIGHQLKGKILRIAPVRRLNEQKRE